MADKKIPVYGPNGEEEYHTLPNARDLLNVGWSFDKNRKTTPMDSAPAGAVPSFEEARRLEEEERRGKTLAQSILDNAREIRTTPDVGGGDAAPAPAVEATIEVTTDEVVEEPTKPAKPASVEIPTARGRGRRN